MIEFRPDRATYYRFNAALAAFAMAGGMIVLWVIGNPHVWTGAVGGLAAIALRAWYLASEALEEVWVLNASGLKGPAGRYVALPDISAVRRLSSAVQIITTSGEKHLIKYQANPGDVIDRINTARAGANAGLHK